MPETRDTRDSDTYAAPPEAPLCGPNSAARPSGSPLLSTRPRPFPSPRCRGPAPGRRLTLRGGVWGLLSLFRPGVSRRWLAFLVPAPARAARGPCVRAPCRTIVLPALFREPLPALRPAPVLCPFRGYFFRPGSRTGMSGVPDAARPFAPAGWPVAAGVFPRRFIARPAPVLLVSGGSRPAVRRSPGPSPLPREGFLRGVPSSGAGPRVLARRPVPRPGSGATGPLSVGRGRLVTRRVPGVFSLRLPVPPVARPLPAAPSGPARCRAVFGFLVPPGPLPPSRSGVAPAPVLGVAGSSAADPRARPVPPWPAWRPAPGGAVVGVLAVLVPLVRARMPPTVSRPCGPVFVLVLSRGLPAGRGPAHALLGRSWRRGSARARPPALSARPPPPVGPRRAPPPRRPARRPPCAPRRARALFRLCPLPFHSLAVPGTPRCCPVAAGARSCAFRGLSPGVPGSLPSRPLLLGLRGVPGPLL